MLGAFQRKTTFSPWCITSGRATKRTAPEKLLGGAGFSNWNSSSARDGRQVEAKQNRQRLHVAPLALQIASAKPRRIHGNEIDTVTRRRFRKNRKTSPAGVSIGTPVAWGESGDLCMKVRDVMTKESVSCSLDTTLAAAAAQMQANNFGFLPVVGDGGNVIGVITDRDICLALGKSGRRSTEVLVRDVVLAQDCTFPKLYVCTPEDRVQCVLKTMRESKIRRMPVVNPQGELLGILSIDDLVLIACGQAGREGLSCREVIEAYQAICRSAPPRPVAA